MYIQENNLREYYDSVMFKMLFAIIQYSAVDFTNKTTFLVHSCNSAKQQ